MLSIRGGLPRRGCRGWCSGRAAGRSSRPESVSGTRTPAAEAQRPARSNPASPARVPSTCRQTRANCCGRHGEHTTEHGPQSASAAKRAPVGRLPPGRHDDATWPPILRRHGPAIQADPEPRTRPAVPRAWRDRYLHRAGHHPRGHLDEGSARPRHVRPNPGLRSERRRPRGQSPNEGARQMRFRSRRHGSVSAEVPRRRPHRAHAAGDLRVPRRRLRALL